MLTIQIQDEQLAQELQQIANRENRPVEDVLKTMVAQYPQKSVEPIIKPDRSAEIQRILHRAYEEAREYWRSVGDTVKAAMTDEELNAQFGAFDEEGVPRLKSEITTEPPVGSGAYAAKIIREHGGIQTSGTLDVTKADDILNAEFADYLLKQMKDEDAPE